MACMIVVLGQNVVVNNDLKQHIAGAGMVPFIFDAFV
jgi:hypothetical protein